MKTKKEIEHSECESMNLLKEVLFCTDVVDVSVRAKRNSIAQFPVQNTWDDFFLSSKHEVSEDFMKERADQFQSEREDL